MLTPLNQVWMVDTACWPNLTQHKDSTTHVDSNYVLTEEYIPALGLNSLILRCKNRWSYWWIVAAVEQAAQLLILFHRLSQGNAVKIMEYFGLLLERVIIFRVPSEVKARAADPAQIFGSRTRLKVLIYMIFDSKWPIFVVLTVGN